MQTQDKKRKFIQLPRQKQEHKPFIWVRWLIVIIMFFLIALGATIWLLSSKGSWFTVLPVVIFAILGVVIGLFQWLFPVSSTASGQSGHQALQQSIDQTTYRGIVGLPPLTDRRIIQYRERIVKEIYTKLTTEYSIAAVVLTGIGGVGKSTLAGLVYRYAEEQRLADNGPFRDEATWLTVDPSTTFADLAANLFKELDKPLPDLSSLAPQNQAVVLFNVLNTTDKPRLMILDQFENLLDSETGRVLANRPGVGEWIDIVNSQPCRCRVLLTSRLRPTGTRKFPLIYMQEYPVKGLETAEGIELLQDYNVKGTAEELRTVVLNCDGHAFALTLLASLLRDHTMSLTILFKNQMLWAGDIAVNLLDHIFSQQLSKVQRDLLLAFSIYREAVSLEAAQMIVTNVPRTDVSFALNALRMQHLLEAVGEGYYRLHPIVATYAHNHFVENDVQANQQALLVAHAKAAQYYLQYAAISCPPREERQQSSDIHPFIEAAWQWCQAEQWQEAFHLVEKEEIFTDLNCWGDNATLMEIYKQLIPSGKWQPERSQAARIYNNLAWVYNDLGQMEHAREYFEQALVLWKEVGNRSKEGTVFNSLGWVYRHLGQKEQARKCLEKALNICRQVENCAEESRTLTNLGIIYSDLGQKKQAIEYYEQALNLSKEIGNSTEEGRVLNAMGNIYGHLGQKNRAREYLEQALSIRRETGNRLAEGRTLKNLGPVYSVLGQNELAMNCCNEALNISREIGDRLGEGKVLDNLGLIYIAQGNSKQAQEYYEQALQILEEVGDSGAAGRTLNNMSYVYNLLGQKEEAFKCYKRALYIFRVLGDRWGEGRTLCDIGEFCTQQNRYDTTFACFLLAQDIFKELQDPYLVEVEGKIDILHNIVGDEQFVVLLAKVEPQVSQLIEQVLHEDKIC